MLNASKSMKESKGKLLTSCRFAQFESDKMRTENLETTKEKKNTFSTICFLLHTFLYQS